MAKKKPPKNDFAAEEEFDVCAFSDEPIITGECIASFSFCDHSAHESNDEALNLSNNNLVTSESAPTKTISFNNSTNSNTNSDDDNSNTSYKITSEVNTLSNNKDILTDNRKSPIVNGCAPPINGEYLDSKRTYMLRSSTVRKLNELKSINRDLNTYVSTIVDIAIAHYYDHIVNEGGTK